MTDAPNIPLPLFKKELDIIEIAELKEPLLRKVMEEGQATLNRKNLGFVYILGSSTGYYKIGQTKDIVKRLKKFEVALPFNIWLELSLAFYDCIWAEKYFHAHFAEKRVNGEWFKLDYNDLHHMQNFSDEWMDFKLSILLENQKLCSWSSYFFTNMLANYDPIPDIRQEIVSEYSFLETKKLNQQTKFRDEFFFRGMEDFDFNEPFNPSGNEE